jgi:hypothetical protein
VAVPSEHNALINGPYSELIRLQTEFQSRLEAESMKYVRGLQAAVGSVVPGTVLLPDASLEYKAAGAPGSSVQIHLEMENRHEVPCIVIPVVSPLLQASGVVWFPSIEATNLAQVVSPNDVVDVTLALQLPPELPLGEYRGAVVLHGFRTDAVSLTITVDDRGDLNAATEARERGQN